MNIKNDKVSGTLNAPTFDNSKLEEYISVLRDKYANNNRVLLVQAPQFLFKSFNVDVARNRGYYAYPPTGLQVIAKALNDRELDISILDLNYALLKRVMNDSSFDHRDWLTILEEELQVKQPAIVGVTSINIYSDVFEPGYPLTSIMQLLNDTDKSITIAGGPIALNEYERYLIKELCHFVVAGEGENKINFLFNCLQNSGSTYPPVSGIYFKSNGVIEETNGNQDIVVPEGNIVETYNMVPVEKYNWVGSLNPYSRMAGQDKSFSVFQLNRGCRSNCKFCGVRDFMGKGVRHFPVADVLEEIQYLVIEKGIRHFDVLDDDFLVHRESVTELLRGLVPLREEYGITWSSNNGLIAVSITEDLMTLMRDSGCVGFRIGVETGNPDMLVKLRKPATIKSLKRAASILEKFPTVFTGGNYIIGLLGQETFGEMLDTFNFSCELNLDWASFAVFQFTSTATINSENLKAGGRTTTDFVPTKSSARREIAEGDDIVSGLEVFNLADNIIPSTEQLNEIWFAFNLAANYINNKNLKPGGIPKKFTSWLEAVKIAYPDNPYMSLFCGLGNVLQDEKYKADNYLEETSRRLKGNDYWMKRFDQYGLTQIVNDFPQNRQKVYKVLGALQNQLTTRAVIC